MKISRHLAALFLLAIGACAGDWVQSAEIDIDEVVAGIGGRLKVGHWTPVAFSLSASQPMKDLRLRLETVDGDGIRTYFSDVGTQIRLDADPRRLVRYAKIGRINSPLTIQLLDPSGQVLAQRSVRPSMLTSSHRLIVTLGASVGIADSVKTLAGNQTAPYTTLVLDDPAGLPDRWFAYESVDTIAMATGDLSWLQGLDERQRVAIVDWVSLGGHLLLSVGRHGQEVFGDQGLLRELSPGEFLETTVSSTTTGLESFAGASQRLAAPDGLPISVFRNVRGVVHCHEGMGGAGDLPTIVRYSQGLGQVTLIAYDLESDPFVNWPDRRQLVVRLLKPAGIKKDDENRTTRGGRVSHVGYEDMAGQLRGAMDRFVDVGQLPFSLVAGVIFVYILLIGPGDYLFLRRVVGRMHWMWCTFPLVVLAFSLLAMYQFGRIKSASIHVNQVDVVDVDLSTGIVRGTMWAHVYSPVSAEFNLTLAPSPFDGMAANPDSLLSWQGLPGSGLGGLRSRANADVYTRAYTVEVAADAERTQASLHAAPILVTSTKSFSGRWLGRLEQDLSAGELRVASNGILRGTVRNPLNVPLADCYVYHDMSVYRIQGVLGPGAEVRVEDQRELDLEWRLQRRNIVEKSDVTTPWDQADLTDIPRIMEVMMFHRAAGGQSYTQLSNRFHAYLDQTELIQTGRAILVGRSESPGSVLLRDGQPLDQHDQQWTWYRVAIPVNQSTASSEQPR